MMTTSPFCLHLGPTYTELPSKAGKIFIPKEILILVDVVIDPAFDPPYLTTVSSSKLNSHDEPGNLGKCKTKKIMEAPACSAISERISELPRDIVIRSTLCLYTALCVSMHRTMLRLQQTAHNAPHTG